MKKFILCGLIISFSGLAQVKIHSTDPDFKEVKVNDQFKVTTEDVKTPRLPSKDERDSLLGGIEEIKDWDELDKDIFVMNLKNKSLLNLSKTYPNIPTKTLKKLKDKLEN